MIEVFHSLPNQTNKNKDVREPRRNLSANPQSNMRNQIPIMHTNLDLTDIDRVPSNATLSSSNVMMYVFEDNEAVIKMMIERRSPTMRHVSRTHRVALDWLFDRIIIDSTFQIRHIDTKHQLADKLTKGNFTRHEWNNLLHLFNISHFSSTCCAKNSSLTSCSNTMAKRIQEQKGERIAAKSKSTAVNLSSTVPASSSSAKDPDASRGPGKRIASGKSESRVRRNSRPDEAPSSQVKLKDVYLGGLMDDSAGKPVATEENQVLWEFSESESCSVHEDEVTGKPVAQTKGAGKPAAFSISENSGNPKTERRNWPHNFYMSSEVVSYMDNVYSFERKTYDRGPTDEMEDLNVNAAIGEDL